MRVSACCHDPFPSAAAHTQQIFWTLVEVSRAGSDVRLHYPRAAADVSRPQDPGVLRGLGAWYGLPADRLPPSLEIRPIDGPAAPRWWSQARFDAQVPARIARDGADLVWTRNVVAAFWLTRAGLPTIFETYRLDLASDWRFALWRQAVLRSSALRGVVHHSSLADGAFARAGVPDAKRVVARNGFAPEWMAPRLDRDAARHALDLRADRPLVVYAGDVHAAKGIDSLLRLAAAVPRADFLIVGANDAGEVSRIERLAREHRAPNVMARRRVPIGSLAPYLYAADCLVIPPPAEPVERSRTVLPIKVFLYLAAGRPILAPRRADLEEVLTDGVTARLTPPGVAGAAVRALNELLDDASLRERLGREALAASGQYTWAARAQRLVEFFERCRVER